MLKEEIYELEIELTTLCNAHCPLCYRNYKSFYKTPYSKVIVRPLDEIIEQLDCYINLNFVMLVGSMSEPTLYVDFIDLVKYLKKRKIRIEICTNGDTRDDIFWKELGQNLYEDDSVYFTVCGSTQKIHEKYRIGTNLKNIIHNAAILRMNGKRNDYAQCIRFNYNSDDLDTHRFRSLISQFSHTYMTETFYPKDIKNYRNKFEIDDFIPNKHKIHKYNKLKKLAEVGFNVLKTDNAVCQSLKYRRQQIDVFGNVYPCYLFLEASNSTIWNQDYQKIENLEYSCCKYCSKFVQDYCKKNKLDYII